MLESCRDKINEFNQTDIYQILTQFLKLFRAVFKASQHLVSSYPKIEAATQSLSALQAIVKDIPPFLGIKNQDTQKLSEEDNTYLRLASRLYENIFIYKNKKLQSDPITTLYQSYLTKSQNFVNRLKVEKDLLRFIKHFYELSIKFCNGCDKLLNNGTLQEALEVLSKVNIEQKNSILLGEYFQTESRLGRKSHLASKLNLNQVDPRFSHMNCLDIDSDFLNSAISIAQNQREEMNKLMTNRNRSIQKLILSYSKQFEYNAKRRQKVSSKRLYNSNKNSRLRQAKSLNISTFSTNLSTTNRINKKTDNSFLNTLEQPSISISKQYQPKSFIEFEQLGDRPVAEAKKQSIINQSQTSSQHKVKNIYLTLDEPSVRTVRTLNSKTKNAFNKMDDINKIYALLKSTKYGFKPNKLRQAQPQKPNPIMEVKRLNLNQFDVRNDNSKLIELLSLGASRFNDTRQKLDSMSRSRKMRTSKIQGAKTLKTIDRISFNQGNTNRSTKKYAHYLGRDAPLLK